MSNLSIPIDMKQIPDYIFNEMLAITKVFADRAPANSTKHINAIRRGAILNKKMQKYSNSHTKKQEHGKL